MARNDTTVFIDPGDIAACTVRCQEITPTYPSGSPVHTMTVLTLSRDVRFQTAGAYTADEVAAELEALARRVRAEAVKHRAAHPVPVASSVERLEADKAEEAAWNESQVAAIRADREAQGVAAAAAVVTGSIDGRLS